MRNAGLWGALFWANGIKAAAGWPTVELSLRCWMRSWGRSAGFARCAVTAELNVEYLKPVDVQNEIVVEGWETEQKGRNLFHVGEIRNAAGDVLARGKGRFVIIGDTRKV